MFNFPSHISRLLKIHFPLITIYYFSNLYKLGELQKPLSSFNIFKTMKMGKTSALNFIPLCISKFLQESTGNLVPNKIMPSLLIVYKSSHIMKVKH